MSSGQEVGAIFGDGLGPATALLRSPTVIVASVALWGMNVCLFRLFGIDYIYILQLDLKKEEEEKKKRKNKRTKGGITHEELPTKEDDGVGGAGVGVGVEKLGGTVGGEVEMSTLSSMIGEESADDDVLGPGNLSPDDMTTTSSGRHGPDYDITEVKLVGLAILLIVTLYVTSYVWIEIGRGSTIGAIFCYYTIVTVGILLPLPSTAWIRLCIRTVLRRAGALLRPRCSCVHGKPRPIPFIDVFFADAMCSLSKVFFDWGMLWLLASYYPDPVPNNAESIIVPSCLASLPYLIRARQCLIMYNVGKHKNDPNRYQHVLNAIKYSTSLFPLIVSAYQKTQSGAQIADQLNTLLIILLAINSTYSLIWDITMDWGMMQNPSAIVERSMGQCAPSMVSANVPVEMRKANCLDVTLRPRLRFGAALTLAVVSLDICLRYSWCLRFYEHILFPSTDAYILCTEFLEVFRRAVWNLLRVEWEHIKQSRNAKKSGVMTELSSTPSKGNSGSRANLGVPMPSQNSFRARTT